MPSSNKQLTPFEQERLAKIKDSIEKTAVPEEDIVTQEESSTVVEESSNKKQGNNKIQTALGTEISQEDLDRVVGAQKTSEGNNKREQTKFAKDLKNILVSVSDERLSKITDALKKNMLKLERVKNDGSGVVVENKDYVPLTIGQNKKVMKVMKRARLLREDINGMGQQGGLMLSDLQKKYPDILDEDVTQDEINNEDILNEMVGNYVIAQKAKIYWGIEDVDNYVLSDIILIIGLYEQRNNFTPT